MFIVKLYRKYQAKRNIAILKKKVTLLGNKYEFGPFCNAILIFGSTKNDIVLENDVTILSGCMLASSYGGKILLREHCKLENTRILCVENVEIGRYTAIADHVIITDNNNHPVNPEFRKFMRLTPHNSDARSWIHADHAPVKIGENCWIGQNVRIQKGVTIGDNSVIAANSVVTKSVPANCIAAGNPAKIVKTDIDKIPAPTTCNEYNEYIRKNGNRI